MTSNSPTIREWLESKRPKYTDRDKLITDCVEALGCTRKAVRNKLAHIWPANTVGNRRPATARGKHGGLTRGEFMARHDPTTRARLAIRAGIERMPVGESADQDEILDDATFRTEFCDRLPAAGFRTVAEEPEFTAYQFRVGDRIYWTTPRNKEWLLRKNSRARDL